MKTLISNLFWWVEVRDLFKNRKQIITFSLPPQMQQCTLFLKVHKPPKAPPTHGTRLKRNHCPGVNRDAIKILVTNVCKLYYCFLWSSVKRLYMLKLILGIFFSRGIICMCPVPASLFCTGETSTINLSPCPNLLFSQRILNQVSCEKCTQEPHGYTIFSSLARKESDFFSRKSLHSFRTNHRKRTVKSHR